jgi:hypothetical protein
MALNQSHESENNGDKLWLLTGMQPSTGVLPFSSRTTYEGLSFFQLMG